MVSITDRFTGQSRGFGFVAMSTDTEAREAIERVNSGMFEGCRLTVYQLSPESW